MVELIEELKGLINDTVNMQTVVRVGKIVNVNLSKMLIDVKLVPLGEQINSVPATGLGVSQGKGVIVAPKVNEYVVMVNYLGRWIVTGYLYDIFSGKGYAVEITDGEVQLRSKTGNLIRMYESGKIEMLNKDRYGMVIDETGHMYLYYDEFDMYSHPAP